VSHIALIVATVLVLGFAGYALAYRVHTLDTGAKRLASVTVIALGCAVGLDGSGDEIQSAVWAIVVLLALLSAWAAYRRRDHGQTAKRRT
jgi:hypothetical protein